MNRLSPVPAPPLWLLVLVTLSGTLAMHMFVPALGEAARDLATSPAAIQSTITLYIVGLALGQLVYGPVSDHIGRRPTLLFGLGLFALAGLVCMLAQSVGLLVAARFMQALGGCAGLLLARAIVRDTASPQDTMRRLATMQLITMVGPGLAPLIGGLVVTALGWRWIFAIFVLLGVAGFVATWRMLPETRAPRQSGAASRSVMADYGILLRSPAFLGCVIGGGCATASFYAFVAAAPFLLGERFGQPVTMVGACLALLIVGVSIGNFASARLAARGRLTRIMLAGNTLSTACAAALMLQLAHGPASVTSVMATMFLYCVGAGICSPAVITKAMSIQPSVAGSASGIYGSGQMAIGAISTAAVGLGHDHGVMAAAVLLAASIVAQLSFRIVRRTAPDVGLGAA
ncbi:MAG TPA: multidrug effflux MFS transporter [Variovorax sp.]|nr:multidrug effflux MFS transporter [Variovorax sp.]